MTEKEKRANSMLYDANNNKELLNELSACKDLCFQFNYKFLPSQIEERAEILKKIIGKLGENALYMKEAPSWCDYTMGNYLGIGLALLVFGVYCIWNDAYMNLNQKPWSVHLMFGVLALCNLGIAENNQRIGTLFADGKLGFGAVNLVFAVMFVVFEIVFFIKRSREKRDLSEEKAE